MSIVTQEYAGKRDLLALATTNPSRYPCLLESVAHGPEQARFDILFAFPQSRIELNAKHELHINDGTSQSVKFLNALDTAWRNESVSYEPSNLPFQGGWVLYLGYELAGEIEPRLKLPTSTGSLPIALVIRCPAAIMVDHVCENTIIVVENEYNDLLSRLQVDIANISNVSKCEVALGKIEIEEDNPEQFLAGVARIHDYLRAGDVFQVNLSREWRAQFPKPISPTIVYSRLRQANPAPFAGLLQMNEWALISSSPERLIEIRDRRMQTRPIAGTRARVAGEDDATRINELIGHPKERAEHVMLIDLERNDLGRVCVPGSIEVNEWMAIESYAHVHHIVSNVRGRLRPEITPGQAIAATFPGGTITGCPKVRCMEIIAELEGVGRGAYTGSLGYLNRDGSLDLNILIRTMQQQAGTLRFRAGAGIVVDSIAERELEETHAKARGMLRALESLKGGTL